MVICLVGTIVNLDGAFADLKDAEDGKIVRVHLVNDLVDKVVVGHTGVFLGDRLTEGAPSVNSFDFRRFLDPMYEADILSESGLYTQFNVIKDPFKKVYDIMVERNKENEKLNPQEEPEEAPAPGAEEDPEG